MAKAARPGLRGAAAVTRQHDRIDLPYTPRQVFDLVADIESYPHFVPHMATARIRSRDGNALTVDQTVRLAMMHLPFTTHAVLDPPRHIHIVCQDNPWGSFVEDWRFTEGPDGGTQLDCTTEFDFRSGLLNATISRAFAAIHRTTMRAFAARAATLYGRRR